MFKYKLYVGKVNWGYMEIDDSGQSLKMVVLPQAIPLKREFLKSLQKKLLWYLESEGFEALKVKH